jgi:threonine dehydratase
VTERLPVTAANVEAAAARLEGVAHRTPAIRSRTLDGLVGAQVWLKAENFQRGGAFKFRGAYNAIASLDAPPEAGVAAYSSGNHAQAVALAASLLGRQAVILMPTDAPEGKVAATRGYGAEIVTYDRYTEDREALGRELAESRGLRLIPPFDHPDVVAGQGTVARELLADVGDLDVLVVPVGGGGLIGGCSVAAKAAAPSITVVGVEPAAGDDVRQSLEAGRIVKIPVPVTIADGLQTTAPGEVTFPIAKALVDGIVTVEDDELRRAMRFLFERMKLVVEPSGAAPVAALLAGKVDVAGKRVGAVISGGNVGADQFCRLSI